MSEMTELNNDGVSPPDYDDNTRSFTGSFSTSIYDTAWVACVSREDSWCFPQSFHHILEHQLPDGLWHLPPYSTSDILNGLGGLFALLLHVDDQNAEEIKGRVNRAKDGLCKALEAWNLDATDAVGFEILVPAMLDLVSREDITFDFPARQDLLQLRQSKLSKVPFELLFEKGGTILHSAEAFFGDEDFDFDRLAKFKLQGSIMASPAASAAFLMRASTWNADTYAYIERVLRDGSGKNTGGVPSAFPTDIFETTWSISTRLGARTGATAPSKMFLDGALEGLRASGALDGRCVGFSSGVQPDLDDTAKTSISLNLLGKTGLTRLMMCRFESEKYCKTYAEERNPSFTANCNALHALLLDAEQWEDCPGLLKHKLEKQLLYLTGVFWTAHESPNDKWNHSPWYPLMLMAEPFVKALPAEQKGSTGALCVPEEPLKKRITLSLARCLLKALSQQTAEGKWGTIGPYEETAYAVLMLASIWRSGLFPDARSAMATSIGRAQSYLRSLPDNFAPEPLWVEKVDYGTAIVSQSYIEAASEISLDEQYGSALVRGILSDQNFCRAAAKSTTLFENIPLLRDRPDWLLEASIAEAEGYIQPLRQIHGDIFKRRNFSEDKYFNIIPIIWVVANIHTKAFLSCEFLFEMMVVSFLNFQADEFMESVVGRLPEEQLVTVEDFIQHVLFPAKTLESNHVTVSGTSSPISRGMKGSYLPSSAEVLSSSEGGKPLETSLQNTLETLELFKQRTTRDARVLQSSQSSQQSLNEELRKFLLAHIHQARGNRTLKAGRVEHDAGRAEPFRLGESFTAWVRGPAAVHTSCAYSFAFARCLLSAGMRDCFSSIERKVMSGDLVQHLATMCRLYNDFGSIQRDRDECNLNSVDFEELWPSAEKDDKLARERLFALAQHERRLLEACKVGLCDVCSLEAKRMVDVFVTVTDMFGQIYLVKDLASRRIV